MNVNPKNPILNVDSYKSCHWKCYPPNTEFVSSYIESRGGRWNRVLFYGLQIFLKEYLSKPITQNDIDEADDFWKAHGEPFNKEGWQYILEKYNGFLPLEIQAVPEGTVLPTNNVLVQVVNTDPKCFWLTSYIETALLRAIWYPTAVATNSFMCKNIILDYLKKTSDNPEAEINFKLHDFGGRGVSGFESAGIGASAHLVNFMGTDTVTGILYAKKYYNENMAGFSIPASEHSTITSWGNESNEIDAFNNMIDKFSGDGKIYACVSDSYNIWEAVNKWYSLKDKIIEKGGTLVIRPDSGNPVAVVSGLLDSLMNKFGYRYNTKGFKVLPDYLRVIQGDGVNENSIKDILQELYFRKISASNIAFGMGGMLLQHLDRDTLRFAMKCSAIYRDGKWFDVYKDPITDSGKKSKKGRLVLIKDNEGNYKTVREDSFERMHPQSHFGNVLRTVWKNGELLVDDSFSEIRNRANKSSI